MVTDVGTVKVSMTVVSTYVYNVADHTDVVTANVTVVYNDGSVGVGGIYGSE
jgi:hypothetical protein